VFSDYLDNAKFIRNSLGSLHETPDHAITAHDEDRISDVGLSDFRSHFEKSGNLTRGYAAYFQRQATSQ
jgi:hypothetical protein